MKITHATAQAQADNTRALDILQGYHAPVYPVAAPLRRRSATQIRATLAELHRRAHARRQDAGRAEAIETARAVLASFDRMYPEATGPAHVYADSRCPCRRCVADPPQAGCPRCRCARCTGKERRR